MLRITKATLFGLTCRTVFFQSGGNIHKLAVKYIIYHISINYFTLHINLVDHTNRKLDGAKKWFSAWLGKCLISGKGRVSFGVFC